jgi:hypothetical protein
MKGQTNNLQVARWTDDPAQIEKFFTEVGPKIAGESRHIARRYGVAMYLEDIESEVKANLWQQMLEADTGRSFAKDSPKEAADFFLEKENYRIREWARLHARKIAGKQSRQAEILAGVRPPDLPVVSAELNTIQTPVLPVGSIYLDDLIQRYLVRIGLQKYPFLTPSELTQYAFLSIFRIIQKHPLVGVDDEHFWDCVMSNQRVDHICLLPDTKDGRNWFRQAGHQTAILFKDVMNVKGFVRRVFLNLILDDIEYEQPSRDNMIDDNYRDCLTNVRQPDLPPNVETELLAIAKCIPRVISETPGLTSREREILRLEMLRRIDVGDLPTPIFDQVAQAAGICSSELRAYNEYHGERGHLSPSDRKAWSRARAKIAKAFTRAKLTSLL